MILNQKIILKWAYSTKEYYISRGYKYTKIGDEFSINVNDLQKGSWIKVKFVCDYCNGKNQTTEDSKWKQFKEINKQREKVNKDCCRNIECCNKKIKEYRLNQYIPFENSVAGVFPELVKYWSKRNDRTPEQYSYGSRQKVWWICDKGHEWKANIKNVTRDGDSCPYCCSRKVCEDNCLATNYPDIASEWDYFKNDFTPFDVMSKSGRKVWWICSECKYEWKSVIGWRTHNGRGCPQCNESKGEQRIRKYLESNKIKFIKEFQFDDLIGTGNGFLRFDFAIFDNNELISLIEYDGQFHFKKVHKDDYHETIVIHDQIKDEYCDDNNIPLLRIPYWEFDNIENILKNDLINYELIHNW